MDGNQGSIMVEEVAKAMLDLTPIQYEQITRALVKGNERFNGIETSLTSMEAEIVTLSRSQKETQAGIAEVLEFMKQAKMAARFLAAFGRVLIRLAQILTAIAVIFGFYKLARTGNIPIVHPSELPGIR